MKKIAIVFLFLTMLFMYGCSDGKKTENSEQKSSVEVTEAAKAVQTPSVSVEPKKETPAETVQKDNTNPASAQKPTPTLAPKKEEGFTLVISENKGSKSILNKKIDLSAKKSLMEYLKEETSLIEEGGFIKSINDISSIPTNKLTSEQKKAGILGVDWFVYVNDKKASTGAYDVYPKSGDNIKLDFHGWTYQDYGP